MALGAMLAQLHTNLLQAHGQLVTVTRLDGTTQCLTCIPQPMNTSEESEFLFEGQRNVAEPNTYNFSFAGDADVAEGYRISFDGDTYLVTNANPATEQGVETVVNVVAR